MIEKINNESVTNIISKCKRFDLKNKKTIAAIVAIIGIIFIFVTINGVLICRQHNAIKAVKKSHLNELDNNPETMEKDKNEVRCTRKTWYAD